MTETRNPVTRKRVPFGRPFLLCAVFALTSTLVLAELVPKLAPGLLRFDHAMGDLRTAYLSDRLQSQHPAVALVSITDDTLKDLKVRQPIDRALLARLVDVVDAASAKAIGIDVLFVQTIPPDSEEVLVEAIRRAKSTIVLAAADERIGLSKAQVDRQTDFLAKAARPAGYVNLVMERDWVIRFKAGPSPSMAFPKSFAALLAESAGARTDAPYRRIAWLLEPTDGSDTFLTIPAQILLKSSDDSAARVAREGLKDKIVIIGGLFPDIDRHLTPLSYGAREFQPGMLIHAHMVAEYIDGRHVAQLETNSIITRLELTIIAALAFLIGWRTRMNRQGLLFGSAATVAIIAVDTFVFWYWRIVLPIVLALMAWFLGEFTGHYIGRWFGPRVDNSRWLVK